ncbi:efflux RND transporter periplasmic adaptor subunit [Pelagibius litoralis]|uniref:Efflux RND transporter periplasmic adaptor subunit n=1 Tax=Pelagibius litoralis TaxID=374515 RepID=A0A967EXG8_9PROT|nr:efflux RND transporter periplasmic adaptor subunit [Pelagibius litoralis]NIA69212.1 efflux RND transporter periplasmic adaptor subunit [Pelagibius litoralis]
MLRILFPLAAAALLAACDQSDQAAEASAVAPPPPAVTIAKPLVKQIVEDDEFVGRFEAVDEVQVSARVGGYLDEIHFDDGAIVEQGQLLFTIDQRPFQAAVKRAEATLNISLARFNFARKELARAEELVGRGNISRSVVDERRQEYITAQADVAGARAELETATLDLEFTEIRAPFSGRIGRDLISVGNLVRANDTILTTVVSLDPIYFYFDINERYYLAYARDARARGAALQEGGGQLPVTVRLGDNVEAPRQGQMDFSENRLDPNSGTMRVRAIFPNEDLVLQPGLFGRVNVPGSLPYTGVLIPDEAISSDQNKRIVYVVDEEGAVSLREVRPGPKIDGYRVIRDGLTGEERIVIEGLMRIRPGIVVAPELSDLAEVRE